MQRVFSYCKSYKFNNGHSYSNRLGDLVVTEVLGKVTTIGINAPDNRNVIDEKVCSSLCNAFQEFENSPSNAAMLYGIGGNFCTGASPQAALDVRDLIKICKKPIVAGLTGYATDFGFELAMLCDLRVMEDTAQIGLNAQPINLSGTFYERLVAIIGLSNAMDLALTGRNLSAKEAFHYGLVNRFVECGSGVGQGTMLAKVVAKYPTDILISAKAALYASIKSS